MAKYKIGEEVIVDRDDPDYPGKKAIILDMIQVSDVFEYELKIDGVTAGFFDESEIHRKKNHNIRKHHKKKKKPNFNIGDKVVINDNIPKYAGRIVTIVDYKVSPERTEYELSSNGISIGFFERNEFSKYEPNDIFDAVEQQSFSEEYDFIPLEDGKYEFTTINGEKGILIRK